MKNMKAENEHFNGKDKQPIIDTAELKLGN